MLRSISDIKYLLAYSIPLIGLLGVGLGGMFTWSVVIYAFGVVPLLELIFNGEFGNNSITDDIEKGKLFFDFLLLFNLPLVWFSLYYGIKISIFYHAKGDSYLELFGVVFSIGIILGTSGINVAHELGHRANKLSQIAAKLLLLPCLYTHFTIEHNRGHHLYVATPDDPATSRKNEWIYFFWVRSIVNSYINAWELENKRVKSFGTLSAMIRNEMMLNTTLTTIYLLIVYANAGVFGLLCAIGIAIISILLLETINYIEHYGLARKKLDNGRYEMTTELHSWNSEHQIGRILLYELTRHSDHHYKSNKPYQTLVYHEESPQLPFGYPGSMLLSLIPPIWFKIMNKRVPK